MTSPRAASGSLQTGRRSPVSRILVHFPESDQAEALIAFAVRLAQATQAHLRGLTLVDTRNLEDCMTGCESVAYAVLAQQRLLDGDARRDAVRTQFSQACLAAGLDFDVRRKQGRLLEVLSGEARYHDLTIALTPAKPRNGELAAEEAVSLIHKGASPLMVVRGQTEPPRRVLLVMDGAAASARAVRSYLGQGLFPDATTRLLTLGQTNSDARQILHENVEYVRGWIPKLETGCLTGRSPSVLPDYVRQWEADLVVLGAQRTPPLLRLLFGQTAWEILRKTGSGLYATH